MTLVMMVLLNRHLDLGFWVWDFGFSWKRQLRNRRLSKQWAQIDQIALL
jgi:hypothetical protein